MRAYFVLPLILAMTACATTEQPASKAVPAPAAASAPAAKAAPQCWSGDAGKFFNVGEKAEISGITVECKPTADGKAAQWMSSKKH